MFYVVKIPWWLKKLYSGLTWELPAGKKNLYLTFDDGPHPSVTPFVLEQLKLFNAKATFFCVGKNVEDHPDIYEQIIKEGHATGNHTHRHLNAWETDAAAYLKDIEIAGRYIKSDLFRPPYGKINFKLAKVLQQGLYKAQLPSRIIMWNVLSGDFDEKISPEKCLSNVLKNSSPGSMVVFHDSEKAFTRMHYALPKVLEHFSEKGYTFPAIT